MKVLGKIGIVLAVVACIAVFAFAALRATDGLNDYIATHATEPASSETSSQQGELVALQPAPTDLVVRFINVGQGDCALLSCDGHYLLIDGGPADASQVVYTVLKSLGVSRLDAIVATHADADHIAGISAALNETTASVCYSPVTEDDSRTFQNMLRYLDQTKCSLVVPAPGETFMLGGATVTFVGPTQTFEDGEDNNTSLVCRVDFGSTSFLFTGDAERDEETAMMESGANLKADVLKVAHHGSNSSSSKEFLTAVSPQYAVISVGAGNTFGHPNRNVLDRLTAAGAQIYRTDEQGSIVFVSDGTTLQSATVNHITY